MRIDPRELRDIARRALREDRARDDVTTYATIGDDPIECTVQLVAKQDAVIAGIHVAEAVFRQAGRRLEFDATTADGEPVSTGATLATVRGRAADILRAERTALNLLQRMSGIATLTAQYVAAVAHTDARIADTRKTVPGLRSLDKYSVAAGGGTNHRRDLSDGVLIKDNHLELLRSRGMSIADIVQQARARTSFVTKIEIEVETPADATAAIDAGADIVLLDNMPPDALQRVVATNEGRAVLEASGGITLETVAAVAEAGVDIISVGELTHSPRAADISLELVE